MSNQQTCLIREVNGDDAPTCSNEQRGARLWTEYEAADRAWERQHAAEWERVDQKLRGIAARRAALDAEEARLLRYADELKLWRAFGFGHMLEYVERVMGYAPHTAAERLRVARVIAELPLITEALENGELAHSAVRELSRVAIPDTEAEWLEAARGKSLREIEAMVSGRKPGHRPTDETDASSVAGPAFATPVQIRTLASPPGGPTWESERRSLRGTADPWALDLVGTPRRLGFHRSSRWRTEPRDHPERTPKGDS